MLAILLELDERVLLVREVDFDETGRPRPCEREDFESREFFSDVLRAAVFTNLGRFSSYTSSSLRLQVAGRITPRHLVPPYVSCYVYLFYVSDVPYVERFFSIVLIRHVDIGRELCGVRVCGQNCFRGG